MEFPATTIINPVSSRPGVGAHVGGVFAASCRYSHFVAGMTKKSGYMDASHVSNFLMCRLSFFFLKKDKLR